MASRALPPPYKDIEDLVRVERLPTIWCPGCGIGIVFKTLLKAIKEYGDDIDRHVIVSGIGCAGRFAGYVRLDGYHVLHGRAIPFAVGLKLSKPQLEVTVVSGDGDIVGIGGNHFIHAARRNHDINVVLINNLVYGMTGGQLAPTTPLGARTMTSPYGNIEHPVNIPLLASAAGATYVARWSVFHVEQMKRSFLKMFKHKGFSVIEIISPCVIYARRNRMEILDMYELLRKMCKVKQNPDPREGEIDIVSGKPVVLGEFVSIEKPTYESLYSELVEKVRKNE
ncbi:MAG: 2-oxoacid:ferredoxin oxidoreductase subunit beta [Crenarchaeota archaeon]|nr:2-oxoacid:ferredoxin oxidoreductase subunit beta [Thermoproteota archaeon]